MPLHVAFLRGVNVGRRQVRMAELRTVLADAGFDDVETYIQTGNVLVRSSARSSATVAAELARVIGEWKGFAVPCVVRTPASLRVTVEAVDGVGPLLRPAGRRYVALADATVGREATAVLDAWAQPGERVRVLGADVLAELAGGFQHIKLSNSRLERITGLTTTWRDLKVVRALAERWGA